MPSIDAGKRRGFSDTAWGKALLLVAVLALAVVATKSCASQDFEVSKEEAMEIARKEVDFVPDRVLARYVPRGIPQRPTWAVSLSTEGPNGEFENLTVIIVDANDGHVIERRRG